MSTGALRWRTSRRSGSQGGQCVEVATSSGTWLVRDSKDRDGALLAVSSAAWHAFLSSIRDGGL